MSKKGLNCPVKDAAWRELLRAVNGNEKEAYRLWLSNNEEVPSIEQLRKEGILPELDKETKFQSVIDNYVDRRTYLYKKLAQLKTDAKSVKGDEKLVVNKEIQRVEHAINNINESIEELQKTAEFEDIYKFAQSDLNEVDAILNSKSVSMNDLQRVNRIIKLWKRVGSLDARNPFFNESELESFKAAKEQAEVRPIRLPSDPTIGEYNFLVAYCRDVRKRILNSDPKIPSLIETQDGIEVAVAKKPKLNKRLVN